MVAIAATAAHQEGKVGRGRVISVLLMLLLLLLLLTLPCLGSGELELWRLVAAGRRRTCRCRLDPLA